MLGTCLVREIQLNRDDIVYMPLEEALIEVALCVQSNPEFRASIVSYQRNYRYVQGMYWNIWKKDTKRKTLDYINQVEFYGKNDIEYTHPPKNGDLIVLLEFEKLKNIQQWYKVQSWINQAWGVVVVDD